MIMIIIVVLSITAIKCQLKMYTVGKKKPKDDNVKLAIGNKNRRTDGVTNNIF